jgi:hypothetical protein
LGHRPNYLRNFDWLSFTPLWSPSSVIQISHERGAHSPTLFNKYIQ